VRAANAHADGARGHASLYLAAYSRGLSELLFVAKQAQVLLHARKKIQSSAQMQPARSEGCG
jgi:16S rRNA G966 N2-methylase RsmD